LTIAVVTKSAGRYRSPALFAPSLRLRLRPQLQVKQMLELQKIWRDNVF